MRLFGGRSMIKTRLIIAVLLMLITTGCKDKIEPGTVVVERPTVTGVSSMAVNLTETILYRETMAIVAAEVQSIVSSRIMGPVASISVREGDRVKAGQLLVVIDSADINRKVDAAEAAYKEAVQALKAAEQNKLLAESTYNRFKNLYDEKALSLQEFDKIETQNKLAAIEYGRLQEMVKRVESGLAEAKVFLGFTEIKAPIDGIVTGKFIDPGSMAMPGMQLLTVEDTSRYRLEAEIDESLAGRIAKGMEVEIEIEALKEKLLGSITEIVPAVDPRSRTFKIFVSLPPDKKLQSGLFARIKIPVGQQELILVPPEALITRGQLVGVYAVAADNVITYRLIRQGRQFNNRVEILAGLKPGDTIITDNFAGIVDGSVLQTEN
jgi:membrane fusion protein, multidrug efflux system